MKIGIMLRHLGQHGGGVLVYTHNLLRELLELDSPHEFVLLYQDRRLIGSYRDIEGVREIAAAVPSVLLWDQLAVPWIESKEKFDVLFNPKYSLPLLARSRTVFVCHGLDWYVMPWGSRWVDRLSHRHLIPRYAKKADAVIAVSETARQHVIEYLGVEEDRVHTVYLGVDELFREPVPQERLDQVRRTHELPERFFLYCGQIYPPKNFARLLEAYASVGPRQGIYLVVAGKHTWLSEKEIELTKRPELAPWVVWPGWIDRESLPAFYTLAEALLLPSLYEACPSPILEAMSTGTPIVTADRYGTAELAGDAAVLVDPEDVASIADGIDRVTTDPLLRERLIRAGRRRASTFSWKTCARETLRVLEHVLAR